MKFKKVTIVIFLSMSVIIPSGPAGHTEDWRLVIDREGISIFTRAMPGSPVDEFKGTVTIKTTLEALGEIMKDIPSQPRWIADCILGRELKKLNDNTVITYSVYKSPWPVKDRDAVIQAVYYTDPKRRSFSIQLSSLEKYLPEGENMVRITGLKGIWIFQERAGGEVSVIYNIRFNPGVAGKQDQQAEPLYYPG